MKQSLKVFGFSLIAGCSACALRTPNISLVQSHQGSFATAIPLSDGRYLTCKHALAELPIFVTDAARGSTSQIAEVVEVARGDKSSPFGGEDWAIVKCAHGATQDQNVIFNPHFKVHPGEQLWITGWKSGLGTTIRKEVFQATILKTDWHNPSGIFVRQSRDLRGCSGGPAWIEKNGQLIVVGFVSRSSNDHFGSLAGLMVPQEPWDFIERLPNSAQSASR